MADSTSNLDLLASSQAAKEIAANALFDAFSPGAGFGRRASTTTGLTWGYYGGVMLVSGVPTRVANGTVALTASNTNYVQCSPLGVVSANTIGFTAGYTRLYTIVAGASSVTSYLDLRLSAGATGAQGMTGATGAGAPGVGLELMMFGDGSDGALTASSGTTTLSKDTFYSNVTLSGTAKIVTNGWRMYVSGTLDITAAGVAAISADGAAGGNASTTSGGSNATASVANTVGVGGQGGNGRSGPNGNGTAGAGGSTPTLGNGGNTQACGVGGAGGTTSGGGAVTTGNNTPYFLHRAVTELAKSFTLVGAGCGGASGGSGGGDGVSNGGGGSGAGGNGGDVLFLAAKTIARGGSTAAQAICARGGVGGNGGTRAIANCGGGAGGAGGGGGYVYVMYETLTGSTATGCLDARGGVGGNGGNAGAGGGGGHGGGGGNGGNIAKCDLTAASITLATPTNGSAESPAPSGTTGGTGGVAGVSSVDL